MDAQEKQDRSAMRETAQEMMMEMCARHDISNHDAGASDRIVDLSLHALDTLENWLYAAYRVNHS